MADTSYAARMRYLDAADVNTAGMDVTFDGLRVEGPDRQDIGSVDGFIVDSDARRVTYVVVDSGGWFTSRRLLLPIGHASLSPDRRAIQTDVTRDALRRLPEFDSDRFRAFTDEDLRAFERNTVIACCPDEPLEDVSVGAGGYDTRRHYREPDWWREARYAPEQLRPVDVGIRRRATDTAPAAASGTARRESHERERVVAHGGTPDEPGRAGDPSPHFEGRAQPGDVLGIETGGERTKVGDTAEDENERRRKAEEARRDRDRDDDPRRSNR
jgi:hypothetical protein